MNTKNLVVTFSAFAIALFLVMTVSAASVSTYNVKVNGVQVADETGLASNTVSVTAGDQMTLQVYFTSDVNDTDVI